MACPPTLAGGTLAGNASKILGAGAGCVAAAPTRDFVLADRVSAARAGGPNVQVTVDLSQIANTNRYGQRAHVRGFALVGRAGFTVGTTNDAVLADTLRALWRDIRLSDPTGHEYFTGDIDGRQLQDDAFMRHARRVGWPYTRFGAQGSYPNPTTDLGIPQNAGPGTRYYDASLYYPLVTDRDNVSPLEGLIPLEVLQRRMADAFKLRIAAALPTASAGLTFLGMFQPGDDGGNVNGFQVWLDIVWLDAIVCDAPWNLTNSTYANFQGSLPRADAITEYLVARYNLGDSGLPNGLWSVANLDNITISIGGQPVVSGMTQAQMVRRQMFGYSTDKDSYLAINNPAIDLPVLADNAGTLLPQMLAFLPPRPRASAGAGLLAYNIGTATGLTYVRFLQRTCLCNSDARIASFSAPLANCGNVAIVPTNAMGNFVPEAIPYEPILVQPV